MQGRFFHSHVRSLLSACAALIISSGCSDSPTGPGGPQGEFVFRASVVGTTIATMVVEVTAPDITTPLVFNIPIAGGVASGTVKLPPGENRTITLKAYDNLQNETHEGSKTISVKPGQNPPVSIPVVSKAGQVPITATMGPVSIVVSPGSSELAIGGTVQLAATITAPNGDVLAGPAAWATLNPSIATVSASGLVTAVGEGSVQIVATYAGVGAASSIQIGSKLAVATNTNVTVYDASTLAVVSTFPLPGSAFSLTVAEGKLYAGGFEKIFAIDPSNGVVSIIASGLVQGNLYGLSYRSGTLYASGSGMFEIRGVTLGGLPAGDVLPLGSTNLRATTFGPDGSFYLTAFNGPQVQRWLPGFVPFGSFGGGGLTTPWGIDTRSNGNVIVGGQNDGAYFVFSPSGAFIAHVPVDCIGQVRNLAVDASDNVWVTCLEGGRVMKFDTSDHEVARINIPLPSGVAVY